VSRSCNQKSSGSRVLVDALFEGEKQVRRPLDFIDDDAVEASYERNGIASGCRQGRLMIERQIDAIPSCEATRKSGLAGLARTADRDDSRVSECRPIGNGSTSKWEAKGVQMGLRLDLPAEDHHLVMICGCLFVPSAPSEMWTQCGPSEITPWTQAGR